MTETRTCLMCGNPLTRDQQFTCCRKCTYAYSTRHAKPVRYCACGMPLTRKQKYACSMKCSRERTGNRDAYEINSTRSVPKAPTVGSDAANRRDVNAPMRSVIAGRVQYGYEWMMRGPGAVPRTTMVGA